MPDWERRISEQAFHCENIQGKNKSPIISLTAEIVKNVMPILNIDKNYQKKSKNIVTDQEFIDKMSVEFISFLNWLNYIDKENILWEKENILNMIESWQSFDNILMYCIEMISIWSETQDQEEYSKTLESL